MGGQGGKRTKAPEWGGKGVRRAPSDPDGASTSSGSSQDGKMTALHRHAGNLSTVSNAASDPDHPFPFPGLKKVARGAHVKHAHEGDEGEAGPASQTRATPAPPGRPLTMAARHSTVESLLVQLEDPQVACKEACLVKLCRLLAGKVLLPQVLEAGPKRVGEALCPVIKKGKEAEASRACLAMALAAVTLGKAGGDFVWDTTDALFLQLKAHICEAVRVKVAETISLGLASCRVSDADTAGVMARFAKCFGGQGEGGEAEEEQVSPHVVQACVEAWALLATFVPDKILLSRKMLTISAAPLAELLSHEHLEVRLAVGQALGVLYEARWRKLREELAADASATEAEEEAASLDVLQPPMPGVEDDNVLFTVNRLATENPKRAGKADRERQWHLFKDLSACVERGAALPKEKLRVGGRTVFVSTWAERRRLGAFKGVLQGGFQAHAQGNELLQELLLGGVDEDGGGGDMKETKGESPVAACELELPPDRPMCHREKFLVHEHKKKARAKDKNKGRDDHSRRMFGEDAVVDSLG